MPCCPIASAVDASLDAGFLLNSRGAVLRKNAAANRLFESERDDVARTHVSSFFVFRESAPEIGGTIPLWEDVLRKMGDEKPTRIDATAFTRDGTSFSALASLSKLGGGCRCDECARSGASPYAFCVFVREQNDERRRYTRNLEKEVSRLRISRSASAAEASSESFFSIDGRGTILATNEAAVKAFGWTREELVGSKIDMVVGGGHACRHDQYIKTFLETGESHVLGRRRKFPARRKDGSEFPVELGLVKVEVQTGDDGDWHGKKIFCAFLKDLSHDNESLELAEAMINASLDPMFQTNEKGTIQIVNDAAVRVFGWARYEFVGKNISMIAGGEHFRKHDQYIARYLQTGEKRMFGKRRELSARRKDGTLLPIELELTEATLASGEKFFCGYVRDLTKQKEKMNLIEGLVESSFDPMFQINEKGIIQLVNRAAIDKFGWTREEFIGQNISMIMSGDHAKMHDKHMMKYLATGVKRVMGKRRELSAKRKDGAEFPIELGLTEVRCKSGERAFCGFVRDLSQQKLDEQRIQRKEELMEGMINSAFDPMFLIDDRGIIQLTNRAAVDHFGWSHEEFLGNNISMIAGGGHSERHDDYIKHYLRTGEKRVIGKRRKVLARRRDGSEFPIELGMREVRTVLGERMFCGFVRDITREKFDEEELAEREKLTRAIAEASPDPLFAIDEHGTIHRVNAAATHQFGWPRDKLLGRNIRMIMTSEFSDKHAANMKRYIETGVGKGREIDVVRHDGTMVTVLLMLFEAEGPFPILLGLSEKDGPKATRLFVAFARIPDQGALCHETVVGSLMDSLKSEQFVEISDSEQGLF